MKPKVIEETIVTVKTKLVAHTVATKETSTQVRVEPMAPRKEDDVIISVIVTIDRMFVHKADALELADYFKQLADLMGE